MILVKLKLNALFIFHMCLAIAKYDDFLISDALYVTLLLELQFPFEFSDMRHPTLERNFIVTFST